MALELRDISKAFGAVQANAGVSLLLEEGTLHGLAGENGAGKSTLLKILSGFQDADSGEIIVDGQPLELGSPRAALAAGIGMLHQDPLVFLPLTVLENFLLAGPGGLRLDRSAGAAELERVSGELGFSFDPNAPVRSLTVGERQQLEITRLLWLGARVLILDEPTTGISATQRIQLFATLRGLAAEGMIVIFVSHKLEEIDELCDTVTVMRSGAVVGSLSMPAPSERLVELMFGQVMEMTDRPDEALGEAVLKLDSVSVKSGSTDIVDLDFSVRRGEVVGLAGLEGSGQRVFLDTCAGFVTSGAGRIEIDGVDVTNDGYLARLGSGLHYVPAGRLEEGLIDELTISEHFLLTSPDSRFFLDRQAARVDAESHIAGYAIRGEPESPAEALSGGNQQRLLLAMMPDELNVLLLEHPTRGLDIESADYVWTRILDRRTQGTAILFASADLDELLRYSDRIVVFFSGRVFSILVAEGLTGEDLGFLIGGKEPT